MPCVYCPFMMLIVEMVEGCEVVIWLLLQEPLHISWDELDNTVRNCILY